MARRKAVGTDNRDASLRAELHRYHECVIAAYRLGTEGAVTRGYFRLAEGLSEAERLQRDRGTWASQLACRYRRALARYTRSFGGKLLG